MDVIETWYFNSIKDRDSKDKKKAIGYTRIENGILKVRNGILTNYTWIESDTEVE